MRKFESLFLILVFFGLTFIYPKTGVAINTDLITFPVPSEFPMAGASIYQVRISDISTGIYTDINGWKKLVSFCYFDFNPSKQVEVVVTRSKPFNSYKLLPGSNHLSTVRTGNTIKFNISKPNQAVTIVYDEDYNGETIHIFANGIDKNAPFSSNDSVIYFGPGYHALDSVLFIPSNKTLYIAGGAVLNGTVIVKDASNVKVRGHGMMIKAVNSDNLVFGILNSKKVSVEGPLVHSHRNPGWTFGIFGSSDVEVKHLKIVSTRYASTDGIDVLNSNRIKIDSSFIRSCDDAIAVKGLIKSDITDQYPPNKDLLFTNLQLWNDCNNAIVLGQESHAGCYENIELSNVDILRSYDDKNHHAELDERSVLSIVCLHGTQYRNIRFENIRINKCERLFCLTFKEDFWYGTLPGDQSIPGGIEDVTFRNISVNSNSGSPIANQVLLNGWHKAGTPDKIIKRVTFDNVSIEGEKFAADSKNLITNNTREITLVKDLIFK